MAFFDFLKKKNETPVRDKRPHKSSPSPSNRSTFRESPVRYSGDSVEKTAAKEQRQTTSAKPKRLGELMVQHGIVTEGQLQESLSRQKQTKQRLAETLMSLGYLTREQFETFLARLPGNASIDLDHYTVPDEIVEYIPRDFAIEHEVFPIDKLGRLLTVGMVCPLDRETIEAMKKMTGLRVKGVLCSKEDVTRYIDEYYPKPEAPEANPARTRSESTAHG